MICNETVYYLCDEQGSGNIAGSGQVFIFYVSICSNAREQISLLTCMLLKIDRVVVTQNLGRSQPQGL